jgi:hypothetical protein
MCTLFFFFFYTPNQIYKGIEISNVLYYKYIPYATETPSNIWRDKCIQQVAWLGEEEDTAIRGRGVDFCSFKVN